MAVRASKPAETTTAQLGREVLHLAAQHGFYPAAHDDFDVVHEMASRLMAHKVTSIATFRAVQDVQPWASCCYREDGVVTGLMGLLLLREKAVAQMLDGSFDGMEVDTDLLSRGRELTAMGYGWGMAATTPASSAALRACVWQVRSVALGHLSFTATAVTPAGRHVCITRLGYRPMRHPDDSLLISDPIVARRVAA
jgi:hypothetical protein